MENMRSVDKFQLEYDLYDFSYAGELKNVVAEIFLTYEEIDVARSVIKLDRKRNRRRKVISSALGKYASKFGYATTSYYDQDNEILDRHSAILDKYEDQIGYIFEEMNDDNYTELCKLLSFVQDKNRIFAVSVKEDRKVLAASAKGEAYVRELPTEESAAFSEWFPRGLEQASYTERVVKSKK